MQFRVLTPACAQRSRFARFSEPTPETGRRDLDGARGVPPAMVGGQVFRVAHLEIARSREAAGGGVGRGEVEGLLSSVPFPPSIVRARRQMEKTVVRVTVQ